MAGRILIVPILVALAWGSPASGRAGASAGTDIEGLRIAWHGCVRDAFAAWPGGADKLRAERAALEACKALEDAYIAAELAARQRPAERSEPAGITRRARAWAATAAAFVVDPLTTWIASLIH